MKTVNLTDLPELVQAEAIAYRARIDEFLRGLQGVECPMQPFVKLPRGVGRTTKRGNCVVGHYLECEVNQNGTFLEVFSREVVGKHYRPSFQIESICEAHRIIF